MWFSDVVHSRTCGNIRRGCSCDMDVTRSLSLTQGGWTGILPECSCSEVGRVLCSCGCYKWAVESWVPLGVTVAWDSSECAVGGIRTVPRSPKGLKLFTDEEEEEEGARHYASSRLSGIVKNFICQEWEGGWVENGQAKSESPSDLLTSRGL